MYDIVNILKQYNNLFIKLPSTKALRPQLVLLMLQWKFKDLL